MQGMAKPRKDKEVVDIADYKQRHIPHRMNLLITFRERMYPLSENQRQHVRDVFRCCKDMSVMMMRFLLDEMGVHLREGFDELKYREPKNHCGKLEEETIEADHMVELLTDVLKFGNRAIAHIEAGDVDHDFRDREGDKRLVEAINYVEQKVVDLIYGSETAYKDVMALAGNNMHRDRLDLMVLIPDKAL
jgi:hypothetical protein